MPVDNNQRWSALHRLCSISEDERRRTLRLHTEAGFSRGDERVQLRAALDQELAAIARHELRSEVARNPRAAARMFERIRGFRELCEDSPAFANYINGYLYFGVRFAAGRLITHYGRTADAVAAWNTVPLQLPPPPRCEVLENHTALKARVEDYLALPSDGHVAPALDFLDDYVQYPGELEDFELWLRGLKTEGSTYRFENIVLGIYEWSKARYEYHLNLQASLGTEQQSFMHRFIEGKMIPGRWQALHPLAARFGVYDLYLLSRLLRADVSSRAEVRYAKRSWLMYLAESRLGDGSLRFDPDLLRKIEEVLRAVFDFACDLVQNAVALVERAQTENETGVSQAHDAQCRKPWREIYDEELEEIARQRRERGYRPEKTNLKVQSEAETSAGYWSRRVRTGQHVPNLIGIAFSGGGIRSATFGLGVLQGLKELDLLRGVDYISTVSGGGYIGAWLVGNVRRTHYWLSRLTSWDKSVEHLRKYSRYLAPRVGVLSADSWVIWSTWARNAFLIQLTAITTLACLFALVLVSRQLFDRFGPSPWAATAILIVLVALGMFHLVRLGDRQSRKETQHRREVLLAWFGSFLTASLLWHVATEAEAFSALLTSAYTWWDSWLLLALAGCFFAFSLRSIWPSHAASSGLKVLRTAGSIGIAAVTFGTLYLCTCGILWFFGELKSSPAFADGWVAFALGPSLVLLTATLAIALSIGLTGWSSEDWRREWWTRYGSWLAMHAAAFLAFGAAAVFGPALIAYLFSLSLNSIKWGALLTWLGSVVAGIVAGNSTKTKGGVASSRAMEVIARIGGIAFIAGTLVLVATLLQTLMAQVFLNNPSGWQSNLDALTQPYSPWPLQTFAALLIASLVFSWRFNLNVFGLNQFYRNRLVRCYLGATRWTPGLRQPHGFIGFDDADDLSMASLRHAVTQDNTRPLGFRGPFPIVNCSLNLGGSSDLRVHTRQSASFFITPLAAGADRKRVGFAPVAESKGFANRVTLGQAISVSGAAANPNMGFNTSPVVAVLLTMFNVRLGWWFPNPRKRSWQQESPPLSLYYMGRELFGLADETAQFVNVSDGGHFENLGIYELIRRRTKIIIASDGECDGGLDFGSLGKVIRMCETDFGATIDIDVSSIRKDSESGHSRSHCAVGQITYSNGSLGYLIYLKASLTGDEDTGVRQYHSAHPDFPHQSTGNQFYSEDQFEAYRRLGYHATLSSFRGCEHGANLLTVAQQLYDQWAPTAASTDKFLRHTQLLDSIWQRLRNTPTLGVLQRELLAEVPVPRATPLSDEEHAACLELLQLMENVLVDLRLDLYWEHPDNRGWAMLFTRWARSQTLRLTWDRSRDIFGIRFEYFCRERLGFRARGPVTRV